MRVWVRVAAGALTVGLCMLGATVPAGAKAQQKKPAIPPP
jgi:hypothetical protein